jgi:hypothetical protein
MNADCQWRFWKNAEHWNESRLAGMNAIVEMNGGKRLAGAEISGWRLKLELDYFGCFFGAGLERAFFGGAFRLGRQHRVASQDAGMFHDSVLTDGHLDLDGAGKIKLFGKIGKLRRGQVLNLAFRLGWSTRLGMGLPTAHSYREEKCYGRDAAAHRRFHGFLPRQAHRLLAYSPMQNRFAGTKPNCAVRIPMTQIMTLLIAATNHPCQSFLPTRTVESTVNTQEI